MSSNISLNDTSFHISLNSLKKIWKSFFSLQNARWIFSILYVPPCVGKIFQFYVPILRKCIESMDFYSWPSSPIKTPGRIFWKAASPRQNLWRKLWFALLKYIQKKSRWPGTLIYLNCFTFAWFLIFLKLMALKFC